MSVQPLTIQCDGKNCDATDLEPGDRIYCEACYDFEVDAKDRLNEENEELLGRITDLEREIDELKEKLGQEVAA